MRNEPYYDVHKPGSRDFWISNFDRYCIDPRECIGHGLFARIRATQEWRRLPDCIHEQVPGGLQIARRQAVRLVLRTQVDLRLQALTFDRRR
jgi:hypothetical protein